MDTHDPMSRPEPQHVGSRVRYWRKRRGLTRQQFAERCGRSVTWVDKIESGERALARLPMLRQVAGVLGIAVETLTDPAGLQRPALGPEVAAISAALADYASLLDPVTEAPDIEALADRLAYVHTAWLSADFSQVGRHLPPLIRDAQNAYRAPAADAVAVARILVEVYRAASSTLMKMDAAETAWLAADRALTVAQTSGDPFCLARAARAVARTLTELGRTREALDLLTSALGRLRPVAPGPDNELAAPVGMLMLAAEITASELGDGAAVDHWHRQAVALAGRWFRAGHDPDTAFGPVNVALHRVAALVRLGRFDDATTAANAIDPGAIATLPRERRAALLLDQAAIARGVGQPARAVELLLAAEQTAPEEVRSRPVTRALIADLAHDPTTTPSAALRSLAQRAGVQT